MRKSEYPRPEPLTFGEDQAVRMTQRTLFLILVATASIAGAYIDLKSDGRENRKSIAELLAIREADSAERKIDREVMLAVKQTLDSLQRRADWQDRRDGRTTSTHSSNP